MRNNSNLRTNHSKEDWSKMFTITKQLISKQKCLENESRTFHRIKSIFYKVFSGERVVTSTPLFYPTYCTHYTTDRTVLSTHSLKSFVDLLFKKNVHGFVYTYICSRECYFQYQTRSQNKNSHDVDNILINRVLFLNDLS